MADSKADTLITPPPMKKMKQARLPFKVLSPRVVQQAEPTTGQTTLPLQPSSLKKRKLSDTAPGPGKASKTPRSDENQPKIAKKPATPINGGRKVDDAENEVSSSSEADSGQHKLRECSVKIERRSGLMDKFLRTTQQLEVSTTNGQVDSTGIIEEYIEDADSSKTDSPAKSNHLVTPAAPSDDIIVIPDNSPVKDSAITCDSTKVEGAKSKHSESESLKTSDCGEKSDSEGDSNSKEISDNDKRTVGQISESKNVTELDILKNKDEVVSQIPESETRCESETNGGDSGVVDVSDNKEAIGSSSAVGDRGVVEGTDNKEAIGSSSAVGDRGVVEGTDNKEAIGSSSAVGDSSVVEVSDDKEAIGSSSAVELEDSLKEDDEATDVSISSQEDDSINNQTLNDSADDMKSPGSEDKTADTSQTFGSPDSSKPAKTPLSSKKLAEKEERRMKREAEKEERRLKKQQELEEKKKQKQEEKDKRDREREELRKQREQEKKDKLEQKEKERLDKLKQKEDEKRKKDEEKRQKEEERVKKLEEKKKELEEKQRMKDEEKEKKLNVRSEEEKKEKEKQQKQKSFFTSYFTKKEREASKQEEGNNPSGLFMQFPVKCDMRLAPLARVDLDGKVDDLRQLDTLMDTQDCEVLYVDQIRQKQLKPGKGTKTWPREDSDVLIVEADKPGCKSMKAKYFLFHENYRPPYYGTWTKTSQKIHPRNPMGKDEEFLDYEVDSDDEWEEEEPGESLSDSGGEDQEDDGDKTADNDSEDEDGFFVPHGYLSEGEGCDDDDEDVTPERLKARQLARAKAFDNDMKKKTEFLKPIAIGCCWWQPEESDDPALAMLNKFQAVPFQSFPIDLTIDRSDETTEKQKKRKQNKEDRKNPQLQAVPDQAMCDLVRLVHGNMCGVQKLIKEFREFWRLRELGITDIKAYKVSKENAANSGNTDADDTADNVGEADTSQNDSLIKEETKYSISKRQLEKTIKEMATYEKRPSFKRLCWYVNDAVLEKHNLKELVVPTEWDWVTKEPAKMAAKTSSEVLTPVEGRSPTPTQNLPNKEGNIMKFAKPGISPKFPVLSPKPVKPVLLSSLATTPKQPIKGSAATSLSPVVSTTPKQSIKALKKTTPSGFLKSPKLCSTPKGGDKTAPTKNAKLAVISSLVNNQQGNDQEMEISEDQDCAIINVELKPDKSQRTLLSMFKGGKKSTSSSKTVAKSCEQRQTPANNKGSNSVLLTEGQQNAESSSNQKPSSKSEPTSSSVGGSAGKKLESIVAVLNKSQSEEVVVSSSKSDDVEIGSAECPMEID